MTFWIFLLALVLLVVFVISVLLPRKPLPLYQYKKKEYVMSRAEQECFDVLIQIIGDKYYVFPQIHLTTFLEHKVMGQSWQGAFNHINQKSVDFVLCDKQDISPKLAIELDDRSHDRPDRQERDREVERILKEAGMPLLRIKHQDISNSQGLFQKIKAVCSPTQ